MRRLALYEPESVLFLSGPLGGRTESDACEVVSRSRELVDALRGAGCDGTLDVEIFSTPDAFRG